MNGMKGEAHHKSGDRSDAGLDASQTLSVGEILRRL